MDFRTSTICVRLERKVELIEIKKICLNTEYYGLQESENILLGRDYNRVKEGLKMGVWKKGQ